MEWIDRRLGSAAPWIGRLAALVLGAVLLIAAYAKSLDPALFAEQIQRLGPIPAGLALPAAIATIGFEFALGLALIVNWRSKPVLILTLLTFVAFTAIVLRELSLPADQQSSCGCFGNMVERTPAQALTEDLIFVLLAVVAFVGREREAARRPARGKPLATAVGALIGIGFAVAAPRLPLDDLATRLTAGKSVADVKMTDVQKHTETALDNLVPGLGSGRQLLLLLDRSRDDEATRSAVAAINQALVLSGESATAVVGIAEPNDELAAQFLWQIGPAFEIHPVPASFLRTLYRTLPRSALVVEGRIETVWNGFPDAPTLERLARGESP